MALLVLKGLEEQGVAVLLVGGRFAFALLRRQRAEVKGVHTVQARLSFIRADLHDAVRRRIMLGMDIDQCQLSKLSSRQ